MTNQLVWAAGDSPVARTTGLMAVALCAVVGWTTPLHAGVVTAWNEIAVRCTSGPPAPPNRPGPPGLLDIALVQAAVHDAVQAIEGRFRPYHFDDPSVRGVGSVEAAAAAATYHMLSGLYGEDDPCLVGVDHPSVTYPGDPGLEVGASAADALLPLWRPAFPSEIDPFLGGSGPGEWRPTPGVAQGAFTFMAYTQPFAMNEPRQFRPPPQPPLRSDRYRREYEEVKALGGAVDSLRTADQTDLARFWVNPITQLFDALRDLADAHLADVGDQARLLALSSLAAADSQISVYDAKYHFSFWRPITAIQEGDTDGNPLTIGDPSWTPFVSTPPYPEYSSGANCLTSAVVTTLQLFFGTDEMAFSMASPAAGLTVNPRTYTRFSELAHECVEVRILQGIHFRSADELGRLQGARIAHWTFMKFLGPLPPGQ